MPLPHSWRSRFCAERVSGLISRCTLGEPYRSDEAVNKDLVLLGRSLLSGIPNFAVATLHQPTFEVDRVVNVRALRDLIC